MAQARKRFSGFGELTLEELLDLRERIENLINERMTAEKRELKRKLARLEEYERRTPMAAESMPRKTRTAAPKYRDPNSGATWSGRGKVPRWMKPLIEQGANRDDFRID
jgi:DNA-binding protein H-NS